ncbi:hypothetical protein PHISCL_10886 [Aspergillus sclerotialis]|uniref:Uncharacterized protein n=1 Tax=Aspergillus sclerotialis TaxID=2070753 RepID=A0A3A2Z604_9EURO|nr:hypothetical protein PHISCL_10886 [Aspergillus sclerotialis]
MLRVMPVGVESSVTQARELKVAQQNAQKAYCDFNFSVAATATNSEQIGQVTEEVGSLFIPFNHLSGEHQQGCDGYQPFHVMAIKQAIDH